MGNSFSSETIWKTTKKPKYFEKYESIFKELFENNQPKIFSYRYKNNHKRENSECSNITLLTSTIDSTNNLREKMSNTRYNILTGTNLNNKFSEIKKENEKNKKKNIEINSSIYNYNALKNLRIERIKNRNVIKNFNLYLRNKGTIPSYHLLKTTEVNSLSPKHRFDNLFIEKIHKKFPEYVNMKNKGQTFLLESTQLNSKKPFYELKNKIGKL